MWVWMRPLTTPLRIVFDSSHKYKGHSLNSYWAKGPDAYVNNLLAVLLKFRENSVGIVGDIKKMYNSVYIKTTRATRTSFFMAEYGN